MTCPLGTGPRRKLDLWAGERGEIARRNDIQEQVINKLRQAEVAISEGSTFAEAFRKMFYSLPEARVLTIHRRPTYNRIRPYGSLGYRPPARETRSPLDRSRCSWYKPWGAGHIGEPPA